MATPADVTEGWPIAQIVLATFSGGIATHLLNAVITRRSRTVTDGRTIVAGSVEWANALHEQNVAITQRSDAISAENQEFKRKYSLLEDRLEEMEDRFNAQQKRNAEHNIWDERAAMIIRDRIDPTFPDPPALEVA
jgi:hypothetical protein